MFTKILSFAVICFAHMAASENADTEMQSYAFDSKTLDQFRSPVYEMLIEVHIFL